MRTARTSGTARRRGLLLGVCALIGLAVVPAFAQTVKGTPGEDRLVGTEAGDVLRARAGDDILRGRGGRDTLRGARGDDRLRPGPGEDLAQAGKGRDRLRARDGKADRLQCGAGRDIAVVDLEEDGIYNCERVKEPKP